MHNSGKCHICPGLINLTTYLLLPTGDEVHALYVWTLLPAYFCVQKPNTAIYMIRKLPRSIGDPFSVYINVFAYTFMYVWGW